MPYGLILSSYVAASRIGGSAQQYVLAADGIEPVLVPTVLLGRSPARPPPGGGPTPIELFEGMLQGVIADGVLARADLILTGHFSLPEQVEAAARAIEQAKAERPGVIVVVDPILGDEPKGLYVKEAVAVAVAERLVPLADWITPNAWELDFLSGRPAGDAAAAVEAAARLGKPALVTSIPAGEGRIGMVLTAPEGSSLISHARAPVAPNGTGDVVTASFGAGLARGRTPLASAERAARAVAEAVACCGPDARDLPLIGLGARIAEPKAEIAVETLA
ncbi:PfkB family carbohydrate kinase [Phenylobacterium sp.]|uniref:PfkB family carbohydrate kinase n=1 Tax=Phenylobacterium sp. TaxID=1871053 RepID=UPI0035AEC3B1